MNKRAASIEAGIYPQKESILPKLSLNKLPLIFKNRPIKPLVTLSQQNNVVELRKREFNSYRRAGDRLSGYRQVRIMRGTDIDFNERNNDGCADICDDVTIEGI